MGLDAIWMSLEVGAQKEEKVEEVRSEEFSSGNADSQTYMGHPKRDVEEAEEEMGQLAMGPSKQPRLKIEISEQQWVWM